MGKWLNRVRKVFSRRAYPADHDYWYNPVNWGATAAGIAVNPTTAHNCAAVLACQRVLGETIASLPLIVFNRSSDGKTRRRAIEHPLYKRLHRQPNPQMTSFTWLEWVMLELPLWGRSYSQIIRSQAGGVLEIWPLKASKMTVKYENGQLIYWYEKSATEKVPLRPDEVLDIVGPMGGKSVITLGRESIGLALATEEYGATFFQNDARPGGILEHPGKLGTAAQERLETWRTKHAGSGKAHQLGILEEGMKFHTIGVPPEDAQFLETRKFQRSVIAGWFRIPPHMIGDLERATFSNIEEQSIEFVIHTIRPWCVRIEQALKKSFFPTDAYFAEFNLEGLLRGNAQTRAEFYGKMVNNGIMNRDEVRQLENLNPMPGKQGKIYTVQLAMVDLNNLTVKPEPEPEPNPEPQEEIEEPSESEESKLLEHIPQEYRTLLRQKAGERLALREVWTPKFEAAAESLIAIETEKILAALKNPKVFSSVVMDYYKKNGVAQGQILKSLRPTFLRYGKEISVAASLEIGVPTVDVVTFIDDYIFRYAIDHKRSSVGQILEIWQEGKAKGVIEEMEKRMTEWTDKRAAKIAHRQVVQSDSTIARKMWQDAGIRKLVWGTGAKPCPFCAQLSGMVVGIESAFVPVGDKLESEGKSPIWAGADIMHPPLHGGCVCFITAI